RPPTADDRHGAKPPAVSIATLRTERPVDVAAGMVVTSPTTACGQGRTASYADFVANSSGEYRAKVPRPSTGTAVLAQWPARD
ncbi:MAG: hypothetical protein ACOC9R_04365, partial [bacterium]